MAGARELRRLLGVDAEVQAVRAREHAHLGAHRRLLAGQRLDGAEVVDAQGLRPLGLVQATVELDAVGRHDGGRQQQGEGQQGKDRAGGGHRAHAGGRVRARKHR